MPISRSWSGRSLSLRHMPRILRGLFFVALLALSHARPALALACELHSPDDTPAAPAHSGHESGRHQGDPSTNGLPREAPACPTMLSCATVAAMPAPAPLPLIVELVALTPVARLLPPPSRDDGPANPPPRS
jgi:hypothetical protein